MLDATARRLITPPLDFVGAQIARAGVQANTVTVAGLLIGALVIPALAFEAYGLALIVILANRLIDGLDGAVARFSQITDLGGYLDIVGDFLFYSAVPFGFALARPEENALAAAFVIFSFIGTGASFLTYAIMAAKRGITTEVRGRKSLYYLGGLTEGTETIVFLILICVFPDSFSLLAWIFGAACWITTISRMLAAATELRD
ncbi:MAG: CDP-alcohol phosphatidyltransferase family protein [Pirellulaceae bacterium]|nr:CDP-alcohol phosphatidyltransferase family protein [Pirellulaceae bacterium]